MNITVSLPVDETRLSDMIINALDTGAISYWCREARLFVDGNRVHGSANLPDNLIDHCVIRLVEDNTGKAYDINCNNVTAIRRALENMPTQHLTNFLNEDDDAETADVFIQTCLFGEIRYG